MDFAFISSEKPDANLLDKARDTYTLRLKRCSSAWPAGSLDASSPYPVLITQRHHDELDELHRALNSAIEDIIERWWTDDQAQFPQRMPLEPGEEDLLRVSPTHPSLSVIGYYSILTICRYESGSTQTQPCSDRGMRDRGPGDRTSWLRLTKPVWRYSVSAKSMRDFVGMALCMEDLVKTRFRHLILNLGV